MIPTEGSGPSRKPKIGTDRLSVQNRPEPSSSPSSIYSTNPSTNQRPKSIAFLSPAKPSTSASSATVSFVGSSSSPVPSPSPLAQQHGHSSSLSRGKGNGNGNGGEASGGRNDQGGAGGVGGVGGGGEAMSRLRRVASNVSIASIIAQRHQKAHVTSESRPGSIVDPSCSMPPAKDVKGQEASEAKAIVQQGKGEAGESADRKVDDEQEQGTVKRRIPPPEGAAKRASARRRTWFGFAPMDVDEEKGKEVAGTESDALQRDDDDDPDKGVEPVNKDRGAHTEVPSDVENVEATMSRKPDPTPGTNPRGWIPWRAPSSVPGKESTIKVKGAESGHLDGPIKNVEPTNEETRPVQHVQQPSSYTDTIRRIWSGPPGEMNSRTVSVTTWGWPTWKGANGAEQNKEDGDAMDTSEDHTNAAVNEQGILVSEPSLPRSCAQHTNDSVFTRWMPGWGSGTNKPLDGSQAGKSHTTDSASQPKTPAEQVKEEALNRLASKQHLSSRVGAREAVLNPATKSMWVNYFASRSAKPASQVETGHEGPEIMAVDFPRQDKMPEKASNKKETDKARSPNVSSSTALKPPAAEPASKKKPGQPPPPPPPTPAQQDKSPTNKPDPAPPVSRPSTPLMGNKDVASKMSKAAGDGRPSSPSNQGKGKPAPPNLILPSFEQTFSRPPRSLPPSVGVLERTLSAVNAYLFSTPADPTKLRHKPYSRRRNVSLLSAASGSQQAHEYAAAEEAEARLPRMWHVMGDKDRATSKGCVNVKRVAIIGVHGWFSQGPLRNVFGQPTGTSVKFATMMEAAVRRHFTDACAPQPEVTVIALHGDGRVSERIDRLYAAFLAEQSYVKAVAESDALFVAAHSQGSVVATHLLARMLEQGLVQPRKTKISLLAMCGIHHGPFAHLRNTVASYYLNTFETPAAKELFQFQEDSSAVSQQYQAALKIVIGAGVKIIYVASVDDQVVPLYSALHSSVSHPSILRALYCDGQAFPRVDFLTNLLSFCVAVRNSGLTDHGLLTLLSASVAGSLYGGYGHSLVYAEPNTYSLAVRYLLEATSPRGEPTTKAGEEGPPMIKWEAFGTQRWNPYALPWSLRGLLEDPQVRDWFGDDIEKLLNDYAEWQPSTKTLKDVQFRLEPMRLVHQQQQTLKFKSDQANSGSSTPTNSKL